MDNFERQQAISMYHKITSQSIVALYNFELPHEFKNPNHVNKKSLGGQADSTSAANFYERGRHV